MKTKFLIIRFSSIGDIVLTSAFVRCLKNKYPLAEIHYLTKIQYSDLFKYNPNIDKIWVYNNNLKVLIPQLKTIQFTTVIDLHNNWRSKWICFNLPVPNYTISHIRLKRFLLLHFKIPIKPAVHIAIRFIKTFPQLDYDGQGLDFFLPDSINVNYLPENYICWVIGANYKTKQLPAQKIIEGISLLAIDIVLLGGKKELELAAEIIKNLPSKQIINFVGKLSLLESAFIIKKAQAIISIDTGMQHIAAALKKKIFAFWGATNPSLLYFPFLPNGIESRCKSEDFISCNIQCQPCHKHGQNTCPKKHFNCMIKQDMKLLQLRVEHFLAQQ